MTHIYVPFNMVVFENTYIHTHTIYIIVVQNSGSHDELSSRDSKYLTLAAGELERMLGH